MKKHKRYISNIIYCMAVTLISSSVSSAAVKFTISRDNVKVTQGNKISVKYSAPGKVKVKSSKKRTAKASIKRKYIVIQGKQPGTAVIKVTFNHNTRLIKVVVKKKTGTSYTCQPVQDIACNTGYNDKSVTSGVSALAPKDTASPEPIDTPQPTTTPTTTPAACPTEYPGFSPVPSGNPEDKDPAPTDSALQSTEALEEILDEAADN